MTAKEYIEQYNNALDKEYEIFVIFYCLIKEIKELAKSRNLMTDAALKDIILEQDRKWRAFAQQVDIARDDAFIPTLTKEVPMTSQVLERGE